MNYKKTIEPKQQTPWTDSGSRITGRLPEDLQLEQVQRVGLLGAVGGGLWAIGLLLDGFVVPLVFKVPRPDAAVVIELFAVLVSALMVVYVHFSNHSAQAKNEFGLGYMIFSSFSIAMLNSWTPEDLQN